MENKKPTGTYRLCKVNDMECDYDPGELTGQPIGMFHYPQCGEMVIAGLPHDVHIKKEGTMQATVEIVSDESKVTKSGKTYYRIQASGKWLSVFRKFNVGDIIEYEQGNLPDWPKNVRGPLGGTAAPEATVRAVQDVFKVGIFGRAEYAALLTSVVELANAAGITDHQAIAALNNTLIIAIQKQNIKVDVGSFIGAPF